MIVGATSHALEGAMAPLVGNNALTYAASASLITASAARSSTLS